MHTLIAAASALIAAATGSGGLQLPSDGPATFDVAGVKLNMTPDEARAALVRAGYKITMTRPSNSFAQMVEDGVKKRLLVVNANRTPPDSIGEFQATGPNGENFGVWFAMTPVGARVSVASMTISMDRQTPQDFMAQVQQRFGKATAKTSSLDWLWCGPTDKKCGIVAGPKLPTLAAGYSGANYLRLDAGPAAAAALNAELQAEIERRAPKPGRSAF